MRGMFQTCIPPLLAQMVCCKVRGAEIAWSETGALVKKMQPVIKTALILVIPADFWVTFYLHFQYHRPTTLLWYSILVLMLAFQKENHLISESFGEEPHKNAIFCLLSGSALFYLLKYTTFHLSFHQHLNPFPHVRGCCSTQTPRFPTPNLCCFKYTSQLYS